MFYQILFILTFCTVIFCQNNGQYCVVDIDSPGIIISGFQDGKDNDNINVNSTYSYNTTELNFTMNENVFSWKLYNSQTHNPNFIREPVLDQYWENFPNNHDGIDDIKNNMSYDTIFSVRTYSDDTFLNLTANKWHHLKVNNLGTYRFETKNGSCMYLGEWNEKYLNKPKNIWKLHRYKYLYINTTLDSEIYNSTENCDQPLGPACISFYLAMCENCSVTVSVRSSNQNKTESFNITESTKWKRKEICSENLTSCFSIIANCATYGNDKGFCAIRDVGYLTKFPDMSCVNQTKRYIYLNNDTLTCENAINEIVIKTVNINETCSPTAKTNNQSEYNGIKNSQKPVKVFFNHWYLLLIIPLFLIIIVAATIIYFCIFKKKTNNEDIPSKKGYSTIAANDNTEMQILEISKWPPIERKHFANYVHQAFNSNNNSGEPLSKQYLDLPSGYLRESYIGLRQNNISKNQYSKIVPYDDNRVKLNKNLGEEYDATDYINASYVHGHNSEKEYIITQNPLTNTTVDFWRMIWQENVEHIVMISGDDEKYWRYWPDLHENVNYAGMEIRLNEVHVYEFYVHSRLQIRRYGEIREINHIHYDSWRNDNKIISSHTFVEFMNHLLTIPHHSSPVVLHCLAGIGRSGTIALCDIALRAAPVTGKINIYDITLKLRNCRINLVQNLKQYQLAHLIVVESLNYKNCVVEVNEDAETYVKKLFESNVINQRWSQYLENTEWIHQAITPYISCNNYPNQNRYRNLLPVDQNRVILAYKDPDYINAMYVDSYRQTKKYIVAQQPLPVTLSNFWLMILQTKVKTVINLNEIDIINETYCVYFPTSDLKELKLSTGITVRFVNEEPYLNYNKLMVDILERGSHTTTVSIINVKNWFKERIIPDSPDVIIDIWKSLRRTKEENFSILMCCDDGVRASGLVVCFFYMIDKILHERKCDLIGAVRAVRRTHINFITIEQFVFLHQCALAFFKNYYQD